MQQKAFDISFIKEVNKRVCRRSFFLETIWNYEKMQNLGFLLCIYPVLKKLYPGEQARKAAVLRQLDTVNTHPSMAPLLVGITARLEHDLEPSAMITYRRRIMAALAAQGDRFFWGHLKPLASTYGTLLSLLAFGSIAGSVALLIIYNVPSLAIRMLGFEQGWKKGLDILKYLKSPELDVAILSMRAGLSLGLGLVAGAVILAGGESAQVIAGDSQWWLTMIIFIFIAGAALIVLRKRFSYVPIVYLAAAASILIFMSFESGILRL